MGKVDESEADDEEERGGYRVCLIGIPPLIVYFSRGRGYLYWRRVGFAFSLSLSSREKHYGVILKIFLTRALPFYA